MIQVFKLFMKQLSWLELCSEVVFKPQSRKMYYSPEQGYTGLDNDEKWGSVAIWEVKSGHAHSALNATSEIELYNQKCSSSLVLLSISIYIFVLMYYNNNKIYVTYIFYVFFFIDLLAYYISCSFNPYWITPESLFPSSSDAAFHYTYLKGRVNGKY